MQRIGKRDIVVHVEVKRLPHATLRRQADAREFDQGEQSVSDMSLALPVSSLERKYCFEDDCIGNTGLNFSSLDASEERGGAW